MTTGPTGGAPTGSTGATGATGATGPTGPKDKRLNTFKVPEQFANEPWAKGVKDMNDLWSKMAGAQKLLGKEKTVIPGENATPEERAAFHVKMGRPENPEGYTFTSIEELKEIERNTNLDHGMKKIFFDNGIPKVVGEKIVAEYEALVYGIQKPVIEATAKRNVEFNQLAKEVIGEDITGAVTAFKSSLRETLGDKAHLVDKLDDMANDVLMPLVLYGKNMHDKYTGENRINRGKGPEHLTGDLKSDYQKLSGQKIAIKMDKNIAQHIKDMKIANLNTEMQKVGQKASEKGIDLFAT